MITRSSLSIPATSICTVLLLTLPSTISFSSDGFLLGRRIAADTNLQYKEATRLVSDEHHQQVTLDLPEELIPFRKPSQFWERQPAFLEKRTTEPSSSERTPSFSMYLASKTKTVHFIRHAEGYHNEASNAYGDNTPVIYSNEGAW